MCWNALIYSQFLEYQFSNWNLAFNANVKLFWFNWCGLIKSNLKLKMSGGLYGLNVWMQLVGWFLHCNTRSSIEHIFIFFGTIAWVANLTPVTQWLKMYIKLTHERFLQFYWLESILLSLKIHWIMLILLLWVRAAYLNKFINAIY